MSTAVGEVTAGGVRIAYRLTRPRRPAAGADVPVLLIHGMGGDAHTWDRVARTLRSRGRTVLAADLRGHGRSGRAPSYRFAEFADDIEALCERAGFARYDVVGHSLGGRTASIVAQRRPGLVRRLVLEEMPMPLRAGDPAPEVPVHRPTPAEVWRAAAALARSPRGFLAYDRALTDPAMQQFRTPDPAWWEGLSGITAPVLFLRGTRPGSMVDPHLFGALRRALPAMTVHEVPCGHSIHRDRRAHFESAVLPFLADLSGAGAGG